MSKNIFHIYLKEAAGYWRTVIYWSLTVVFFLLSGMSKYQGYAKANVSMNKLVKSLPPALSAVFGLGKIDLSTVGGYFAVMALYLSVLLSVQAVLLGAAIIAKEERDKTAEFLFSKPVSRRQVLIAKLTAAVSVITILNIITTIASILIVNAFVTGPAANDKILLQTPGIYFIQLIFLAAGFFFGRCYAAAPAVGASGGGFLAGRFYHLIVC